MTLGDRTRLTARRVAAYVLDVTVLMVALAIGQAVLWTLGLNWAWREPTPWRLQSWVLISVTLPCVFYFALFPWRWGRTLGQRLLGLEIIGTASAPRAFARAAVMLVPFEANHVALFHGGAGANAVFWIAEAVCYGGLAVLVLTSWLDREGRGLHDRIGGVRIRRAGARI